MTVTYIISTSIAITLATYCFGISSLYIPVTKGNTVNPWIHTISKVSHGILLSTALVVVIPEGVDILYSDTSEEWYPKLVGFLLGFGYLSMLIVDKYFSFWQNSSGESTDQSENIDRDIREDINDLWLPNFAKFPRSFYQLSLKEPILVGLVVHSVADGIAFGSASVSSKQLSLVVLGSVIVHKLPTAFSIGSTFYTKYLDRFYRPEDLEQQAVLNSIKQIVRLQMLIFGASASVFALITYFLTSFVSSKSQGNIAASLVIFSGGTFLYVASHLGKTESLRGVIVVVVGFMVPIIYSVF